MDQRYSSQMDQCYSSVLQPSFIQKINENASLRHKGIRTKRREEKEREREREREPRPFGSSFYDFFSPPGPTLCKLGQPGVLFVVPEVFTLVLRPSFYLFSQAFPFLVFQPLTFWTPFSYSNYLTTPWTAASQASLSFTISYCLLKFMSIESVIFLINVLNRQYEIYSVVMIVIIVIQNNSLKNKSISDLYLNFNLNLYFTSPTIFQSKI